MIIHHYYFLLNLQIYKNLYCHFIIIIMKILKLYNMLLFHNYKFLKFDEFSPNFEYLIEFLEINGKNLKEVHLGDYCINSLNLAIAKFCPNLKLLNTGFNEYDVEILKVILNSCQQLESIKVWG